MSLDFPGLAGDEAINLGTGDVPVGTAELSVTAWINPDAVGLADEQVIIAKSVSTGNTGTFKMQVEDTPDDTLRVIVNDDPLDSVAAISAAVWTFVAFVYDGATKKIFINAVENASEAQTGVTSGSADPLRIAAVDTGSNNREWDGLLADIRVYTRALSLAELETMFTLLGIDNIVHGLFWRWRMNELAPGVAATIAGSIIDSTGRLDGTPENSPVYAEGILR